MTERQDLRLAKILLYIYLSFVLFFMTPIMTQLPLVFNYSYNLNLVPFDDYVNGKGDVMRQLVLNVITIVTFGFLFLFTQREEKRTFSRMFSFVFSFTLSKMVLQT